MIKKKNGFQKEKERRDSAEDMTDDQNDWSDWQEVLQVSIVCLFCDAVSPNWEGILDHLQTEHKFNYEENTSELGFYEQVIFNCLNIDSELYVISYELNFFFFQLKLVNYIRRQVYKCRCINCEIETESRAQLLEHMESENHLMMPQRQFWDQPELV